MSAENVSVGGSALLDGILERAGNVLLTDNFREFLRTVFACQNLIAHGVKLKLYVINESVRAHVPARAAPAESLAIPKPP